MVLIFISSSTIHLRFYLRLRCDDRSLERKSGLSKMLPPLRKHSNLRSTYSETGCSRYSRYPNRDSYPRTVIADGLVLASVEALEGGDKFFGEGFAGLGPEEAA